MALRVTTAFIAAFAGIGLLFLALGGAAPSSAAQPLPAQLLHAQSPQPFQPIIAGDIQHDTSPLLSELSRAYRRPRAPQVPQAFNAINRTLPKARLDPKFLQALRDRGIDPVRYLLGLEPTDPVVQGQAGLPDAPNAMPPALKNFEGVSNVDAVLPPDPDGDIGYDPATNKKYYMQWVNLSFAIWDVTGTPTQIVSPTSGNALWAGFGGPCETSNDGDPIVLFDQLAKRWLASQFALPNSGSGPYYQCIAISQTANPTGAWYRYAFLVSTTNMNDYPKFGIWPDGYYMTVNQFVGGYSWGGAGVFVFDRVSMLSGLPATFVYFDLYSVNPNFGGMLPSDWDGDTPPPPGAPDYFLEADDDVGTPSFGADALRIWKFHADWTTPANSTFGVNGQPNYTLTVAPFDLLPCALVGVRSCIPQPGTTVGLDAIGERLMHRAAYRNINGHETIVVNHTVNAGNGRAGVRWYEVRDVGSAPSIYQQGTYAPSDTEHRWMSSIAMDHVGNIALGFSVSSGSVYPSIRYTGRLSGDPLGVMAQGEASIISGTGSQLHDASRWGDYSMLGIDPEDDCTFYYTNEYLQTTGDAPWQTRIASFKFPNCSRGPQGTLAGAVVNGSNLSPIAGAQINATLSPTQTYIARSNANGRYSLPLPVGTYTIKGAAYGYVPASIGNVRILSGTTTTQNISLTPAPTYVISGFVRDNATHDPLYATVSVIGVPFNPPFAVAQTNPATGFYSMTLAGSQSYTLTASALLHVSQARGVTPASNRTENFNLVATAQNGGIIGYVKNYYTRDPVPNAAVTVAAPGNPSDQTDVNGYFEILNLTPGYYTATAAANLYSSIAITNIRILSSNVAVRIFLLPTSHMELAPAALQKTLIFGGAATDAPGLVISNTGLGALTFELQEQAGGFTPLGSSAANLLVVNADWSTTQSITQALTTLGYTYEVTTATDFNAQPLASLLSYQAILYAGSPYGYDALSQLTTVLDHGGRLLITGDDVGYFYGDSTFYQQYLEAQYLGDNATYNSGSVIGEDIMMGLSGDISADPYPDYYRINGTHTTRLFVYSTAGPGNNTPAGSRTARDAYRVVYLPFRLYYLGSSAVGDPIETDVMQRALSWLVGGSNPIPWLSASPLTATLTQSATQNIQVGWQANVAEVEQPGVYTGALKIVNNDPAAQNKVVPVRMTVLPAANQGLLTGAVSTSGVCDVSPAPLAGATVFVQRSSSQTRTYTRTLTTDARGVYRYWLDMAQNPYSVTVSYPGYLTKTVQVSVVGQMTTTQDFTLRLMKPCVDLSPKELAATVLLGNSISQPLVVTSSGVLPLDFTVIRTLTNRPFGGPDAFGYRWITSTYNWIDATGGAALNLFDDSASNIPIPFAFPFYGDSATVMRVGNNGAVLFGASSGDISFANTEMSSAPDNLLAPFWDDMGDGTGNVYWAVVGSAPNRQLVIEWYDRPHYYNVGSATFEMVLYENGNILYQYQDVDFGDGTVDNGASATTGIRGVNAADSLQYSFDQPVLGANRAICFVRPGNLPCDTTDVPWLSTSITSAIGLTGTPPTAQTINLTFNAAAVRQLGIYTAALVINHDAPQPAVMIPVTMNVAPPANYGAIQGTVTGPAACNQPSTVLNGALITFNAGAAGQTTTNSSGYYLQYLAAAAGPQVTMTVSHAGYVTQTTTVSITPGQVALHDTQLRLNMSCLSNAPNELNSLQPPYRVMTKSLYLTNTGGVALNFNFAALGPLLPVQTLPAPTGSPSRLRATSLPLHTVVPAAPLVNTVQDGGFESGTPNPAWHEFSLQFGTPICRADTCGTGGGTAGPHSGMHWAWFGGTGGQERSSVSQTVMISNGTASLAFWFRIGAVGDGGNDYLRVLIDAVEVFSATRGTPGYASYAQVVRNINAFADGRPHVLTFESQTNDTTAASVTNFNVDDVTLDSFPPPCTADVLPWIKVSPVSGTLAAGSRGAIDVIFDSNSLMSGICSLYLDSNDPTQPRLKIPVSLLVRWEFFLPVVLRDLGMAPPTPTPVPVPTHTPFPVSPTPTAIASRAP